ncbi:hypothetical protein [Paenibacillus thalictri]|uniref:DUF4179 domain-containing protein n=1 Tax=Paenibacillus thalictri TaxID=2527873 RepID=A0A4Q9DUG6_9BACL|nr:hypothetical protein [Paenibacillus thalictri]TBL79996.1 hypothetical protein EYB31_10465 [Paenibacillus thalictri]
MKVRLNQVLSSVAIASSLLLSASPLVMPASSALAASDTKSYAITNITQAQIKSVLQEKTATGWRIGSVFQLTNTSGSIVRIPDFELRAKAADGTVFTLQPSSSNAKSISPQSSVDLSYMVEADVKADIQLTDLLWVDVDLAVYPKKETVLADAPVSGLVWKGGDAVIADTALKNWGDAFTLPLLHSSLTYSAVSMTTQYDGQSPVYVLQIKAENPGGYTETVPDFTISAKTATQAFIGKRLETAAVSLNPGEQQYIHIAIKTDPGTQPSAFYVLTPQTFAKAGQAQPLTYYTGEVGFHLPAAGAVAEALPAYTLGSPITFDSISKAVSPQLTSSLLGIEWFENEGQSYKTAIAKLKYTNSSESPVPVPQLGADLVSANGVTFNGGITSTAVKDVLPGVGSVVTYAFAVPNDEVDTQQFTLRLLEQQDQAGFKSPIAQLPVGVAAAAQPETNDLLLYPYEVKMSSWSLSMFVNSNATTQGYNYTFRLKTDLDITTTDQVITDPNNPKLLIEIIDDNGVRQGSKSLALTGDGRIVSGTQTINFTNLSVDQLQSHLTLKIYETQTTPLGDAKRLLTVLKQ